MVDILKNLQGLAGSVVDLVKGIPVLGTTSQITPQYNALAAFSGKQTLRESAVKTIGGIGIGAAAALAAVYPTTALNLLKGAAKNPVPTAVLGAGTIIGAGALTSTNKPLSIPGAIAGGLYGTGKDLGQVAEGKQSLLDVARNHPYITVGSTLAGLGLVGVSTKNLLSSAGNIYAANKIKKAGETSGPSITGGYANPNPTTSTPTKKEIEESGEQEIKKIEATTKSQLEIGKQKFEQEQELLKQQYEADKKVYEEKKKEQEELQRQLNKNIDVLKREQQTYMPEHGTPSAKTQAKLNEFNQAIAAQEQQLLQVNAALAGLPMPVAPVITPYTPPKTVTRYKTKKKKKKTTKKKKRKVNKPKKKRKK